MSVQSIIQLLGGVGLFLFAIKLISEALQLIAGDRLRQLIGTLTKTPIMGVLVGACVTVLIQSSSATTVMTVSFVDAGLMTLTQAIGVIMGANIGTTITGQILAIKVQDYAYLFIIIGVLLSFFGRSKVQKYAGNGLLGFGLLFVGMQTMESSMSFLRNEKELFLMFSHNPLMGVLAGTLLTLLVQSSAATVGLTIALGVQGLLPLHAAIPIILGDNIGTTITAVLASIGTDRTAKQACAAHSGCHRRKKSAPAAHSAIENRIDCLDRDQQRQIHRNDHGKQPHRQLRQEQQARAQQQLDSRQQHGHPAGAVAAPPREQQVHKAAQRQEQARQQQHDMRRSGASGHQRGAEAEHTDAGQHGKQQQIQQSHHGGPSSRQALRASACQKRPFGLLRQAAFRIAKSGFDSLTRCVRYSDWIDFAYSEGDMPNLSLNWREKWWIVE